MHDDSTSSPDPIPYGYCHCGCGEKTSIAQKTVASRGYIKGQPTRFLKGHSSRGVWDGSRQPYWSDVDECYRLPLAQGTYALLDEQDLSVIGGVLWSEDSSRAGISYAKATMSGRSVFLHRLIMNPAAGMVVDHINHNGLDNRRSNLRVITPEENQWNRVGPNRDGSSGFIGVTHDKKNLTNPWLARIRVKGRTEHLGQFATPHEAAIAYDKRAIEVRGELATLNFPTGPTRIAAVQAAVKAACHCREVGRKSP